MTKRLPDFGRRLILTDGGLETCMIFHEGFDLPEFAAFDLLRSSKGRAALDRYYRRYLEIAAEAGTGFILESVTWRASPDWGEKLGLDRADLSRINRESVEMLKELREEFAQRISLILISGCLGPRGDGYDAGRPMSVDEAAEYHAFQAHQLAQAGADMITAFTMTNAAEACGAAIAARRAGLPSVISFTLETDSRLPSGETLAEAVAQVDALGPAAPAYYMINCAHPSHFEQVLDPTAGWVQRVRGLRTNASRRSHAELDQAEELDEGDPVELGMENAALASRLPALAVLGGCCGTDHRHVASMWRAWQARQTQAA